MIIRTYDEEENKIVKVWTPERIAEVKELKPIGGFDTETLEASEQDIRLYGLTELEYDAVVYVDNAMSICRNTSGWDAVLCQEHVKDRVLYRCFFCHEEGQQKYCKTTNSSGRRCAQIAEGWYNKEGRWRLKHDDSLSYCKYHSRERESKGWRFNPEEMWRWMDGYQRETVMLWKRDLIQRLQTLGEISFSQLMEMRDVFKDIKRGLIRPSALPTKTNTYFVLCDGYVKIGRAKDPEKRFADLCRDGDPTIRPKGVDMKRAKLLGWVPGSIHLETDLHGSFTKRGKWVEGEWFHYDSEAALLIDMLLGSGQESFEWVVDDLINNYDQIISHDVQGGHDFKMGREYFKKLAETFELDIIEKREKERKLIYGF